MVKNIIEILIGTNDYTIEDQEVYDEFMKEYTDSLHLDFSESIQKSFIIFNDICIDSDSENNKILLKYKQDDEYILIASSNINDQYIKNDFSGDAKIIQSFIMEDLEQYNRSTLNDIKEEPHYRSLEFKNKRKKW